MARTLNEYTTGYLVFVVLTMGFVIPWLDGTLTNSTDVTFVQVRTLETDVAWVCESVHFTRNDIS